MRPPLDFWSARGGIEAVKTLVIAIGPSEAARRLSLSQSEFAALRQRCARENWLSGNVTSPASNLTSEPSMSPPSAAELVTQHLATVRSEKAMSQNVTTSDALAAANAENGARSRSAALRYSARGLEHLADLPAEEGVLLAPQAASLVKVASTAGDWSSSQRGNVRINILAADPFSQVQIEPDK